MMEIILLLMVYLDAFIPNNREMTAKSVHKNELKTVSLIEASVRFVCRTIENSSGNEWRMTASDKHLPTVWSRSFSKHMRILYLVWCVYEVSCYNDFMNLRGFSIHSFDITCSICRNNSKCVDNYLKLVCLQREHWWIQNAWYINVWLKFACI